MLSGLEIQAAAEAILVVHLQPQVIVQAGEVCGLAAKRFIIRQPGVGMLVAQRSNQALVQVPFDGKGKDQVE